MKAMKKVFAILLALVMVLGLGVTAFADNTVTYSITINNAVCGQTYTAYKIFDVTYSGTDNSNVAYSITSSSEWFADVLEYMGYTNEGESWYLYTEVASGADFDSSATYYTLGDNGTYTKAENLAEFAEGTTYYTKSEAVTTFTGKGLTLTPSVSNPSTYVVTANVLGEGETAETGVTYFNAEDFAAYLSGCTSGKNKSISKTADYTYTEYSGSTLEEGTTYYIKNSDGSYSEYTGTTVETDVTLYTRSASATLDVSTYGAGYYFVDTSLGALSSLDTVTGTQKDIYEKNEEPAIEKKILVTNAENTTAEEDSVSASVGDTINFQITLTAGGAADTNYVVHDTMSDGLTLKKTTNADTNADTTFTIKLGDTVVDSGNYTVVYSEDANNGITDGCTFEITFKQAYTAGLTKGAEIVITYSAVLNDKASLVTNSETNSSYVTYGNTNSVTDEVTVYSYSFDIVKTDSDSNVLTGAKFKLYDAATGGNEIALVKVEEKDNDGKTATYYRPVVEGETGVEIEAGTVEIRGLASGTYYLEETHAPDGYNMLTKRESFTIINESSTATLAPTYAVTTDAEPKSGKTYYTFTAGSGKFAEETTYYTLGEDGVYTEAVGLTSFVNGVTYYTMTVQTNLDAFDGETAYYEESGYRYASGGIQVVNQSGTELPATGGIGTTIFYVIGSILVIGAAILLITRKRMSGMEK